jgi:hypothetical protein
VVTILRPARTPKGTEVRTVVKHVNKLIGLDALAGGDVPLS